MKNRKELELNLIQPTLNIKRKRKIVKDIKQYLFSKYAILEGNVQTWINDPSSELQNLDQRLLCLFAEQIYAKTGIQTVNPEEYFTEAEIKKSKQYDGRLTIKDDIEFPYVLENMVMINPNEFVGRISIKTISQFENSQKLHYNFDIQREHRLVRRGDNIIKEATLIMENVKEIKQNLKDGKQKPTAIVLNASVGSADSGDELIYDHKNMSLTINEGTILDIVDGYHRCKASTFAINENPDIEFSFVLIILNYTDEEAALYQGQLAKATPVSRHKQRELSGDTNGDLVAKSLMRDSELKGKVSSGEVRFAHGELVSYGVLADTIESQFVMERNVDVYKVTDYLKKYFDFLLGVYSEQFLENSKAYRKTTVMVDNNMFVGYIVLARKMMEQGINPAMIEEYINKIDFSRENKLWHDIGYLENGKQTDTKKARETIKNYFESLDI
ncbi:DNA sulfur modification protein DndB [Lederbergia lenta]|uniref:DNA sulfur modification protein DndB n=1 Tax=Lederbergia lenta TaxID=1467 RepID=UPI00204225E5|nr:DNA sulfur modification protein DndB [Lederbergia lenta]MCM3109942.1 hypothetical protein [Lederbergia lenta]